MHCGWPTLQLRCVFQLPHYCWQQQSQNCSGTGAELVQRCPRAIHITQAEHDPPSGSPWLFRINNTIVLLQKRENKTLHIGSKLQAHRTEALFSPEVAQSSQTMWSSLRTSQRFLVQTSCVFVCLWSAAPPVSSLGARCPERVPLHSSPPGLRLLWAPLQWQRWPLAWNGPGHLHRCTVVPLPNTLITLARPALKAE